MENLLKTSPSSEPKKVVVTKPVPPTKKDRKIVSFNPSQGKAVVSENGKESKVSYYASSGTKEGYIGVSGKSVPLKD